MTIYTGTFIPYDYADRWNVLHYIESYCQHIKKSIRIVEKDKEHLCLKCPMSINCIDIHGDEEEIEWLHNKLEILRWYRT